jgi:elongation factor Ts
MADIDAKIVMKLRQQTGAPMMECKKALAEAGGDMDKAVDVLRKRGIKTAESRAGREVTEGVVFHYVHHNEKLGVLCEIACETDFVARNEEFRQFGNDLCLHIAAMKPLFLDREAVDPDMLAKEREVAISQTEQQLAGKPKEVIEKAAEGRLAKFFEERCLLEQPFVKDDKHSVEEVRKALVGRIGENIQIRRFVRMELGG